MADSVIPFAQGQDAAAQAAIQANLTYRAVNNPETLTPAEQAYLSNKVISPTQGIISQSQDAVNEAAKQQAAFSQPRTDTREVTSPEGRAIIAQYAAQHPGWTEKPIQYEKSAAGIAAELAVSGGATGLVGERARAEGYNGPLYAQSSQRGVANVLITPNTPQSAVNMESYYGISTVPTRDYSSGMYTDATVLDNGQTVTGYAPIDRVTQVELLNSKILLGYNTGEIGIYQKPVGHSLYNLASSGSRAAVQSGMFTVGKAQTPFVVNQWDIGTYTGQVGSKGYSRLGAEAYGGYVAPLDGRLLGNAQLSTYENILNLANYVNPQGPNLSKVEAPGADIPWAIGANSPAIQYVDSKGVVAGSGVVFSAIVPETAKVETKTKAIEISPGVYTTGEISYIGSSGRLPVVAGSYKSETINKPGEASLSNFATNLYGNVVNTLGGLVGYTPNLETTKGFAETTTKEEYQVSLPQAYVSQAPKAYVASPIIMDMKTVTTEKEASLYETYNVQLSSAIPKLPAEMTLGAARGEYNAIDSFAIGAYEKASTRPLDVIKYADIGALIVIGGGAIGGGVSALAAGTRAAPVVAAIGEAAPGFFGTLYGYSVSERATEGFKDFGPSSATRLGGIASTEAIPMLAGGVFAARPTIGYEALSAVERVLPDIRTGTVKRTPTEFSPTESISKSLLTKSIDSIPTKTASAEITLEPGHGSGTTTGSLKTEIEPLTRLYRGESLHSYREGVGYGENTMGRWFTENLPTAEFYKNRDIGAMFGQSASKKGVVSYIDIPSSKLNEYYAGEGVPIAGVDIPTSEYILPSEIAVARRPLPEYESITNTRFGAILGSLKHFFKTPEKTGILQPIEPEISYTRSTGPSEFYKTSEVSYLAAQRETGIENIGIRNVKVYPKGEAGESIAIESASTPKYISEISETPLTEIGSAPIKLTRSQAGGLAEFEGYGRVMKMTRKGVTSEVEVKYLANEYERLTGNKVNLKLEQERYFTDTQMIPLREMGKQTIDLRDAVVFSKEKVVYKEYKVSEPLKNLERQRIQTLFDTAVVRAETPRPKTVATRAEQSMVITQYGLTKEEISLAKIKGWSLNDILAFRESVSVVTAKTEPSYYVIPEVEGGAFVEPPASKLETPIGIYSQLEERSSRLSTGLYKSTKVSQLPEASISFDQKVRTATETITELQTKLSVSKEPVRTPATIPQYKTTLSTGEVSTKETERPILLAPSSTKPPSGNTTWDITTTPTKPNIPPITPPPTPPPPPIPIVLPVWNPGQGGYATGTKRYRRKVQFETSAYLPNFVEKKTMEFFRAVGKGKIASASPTGKITVTSYPKKSRRK